MVLKPEAYWNYFQENFEFYGKENLNKEDLHKQYISPYDIDPKYLKTDKSKIIINKDEKIMKDYTELEKKVGII